MTLGWVLAGIGGLAIAAPFVAVGFNIVPWWPGIMWALAWQVFVLSSVAMLDNAGHWPS